jgi:hypothetical protein
MRSPRHGSAGARATALLTAVRDDPAAAASAARALRSEVRGDPETLAILDRVLAVAASSLGEADEAVRHASASLVTAESHGLAGRAAEARMTLALPLLALGRPAEALEAASAACEALRGVARARAEAQRALVLQRLGRTDDALAAFRRALGVLRRGGDAGWEVIARSNRGILHVYRRDWRAAERDLARAVTLAEETGERHAAAFARHNLGFLAAWRGDVPGALAAYDAADAILADLGLYRGPLQMDRAETLLSAGLAAEARDAGERAVTEMRSRHMEADLAEARLVLAQAMLAAGDPVGAREEAANARRAFARQQRPTWEALARYVRLRARWASAPRAVRGLHDEANAVALTLDAAGWPVQAADARLIAARAALRAGQPAAARPALAAAAAFRRRGPAALRAGAWYAEALRREHEGDRRGAYAAAHAGLRVLDRYQAAIGASELRARAGGQAGELSGFGLRLALEERNARRVLAWSERGRSRALRSRPVRPPQDGALADDLASLRATAASLDAAALGGQGGAGSDVATLRRRMARLEQSVRRRAQHARGVGGADSAPVDVALLRERLGDRALVSFVGLDGALHAVVLAGGRARLRTLGPSHDLERELASLRFDLRRLARAHGTPESQAAAQASALHGANRLDALLLAPLARLAGDRELVLVPTGPLHATPWSLLPSCSGRPLSVVPSAASWLRAARARSREPRTVLVGAADPPHAPAEVNALGKLYPGAERLVASAATAAAVTAAIDGAHLAHIACHGHFRADNPLFSHLRLADGPLTVYDLEGLGTAPHRVVLSACESGLSGVAPGDELMGLAASLLALGTASLVASVVPVADEATRALMIDFHGRLGGGQGPAAALAGAQEAAGGRHLAAAAGFVCFGAG